MSILKVVSDIVIEPWFHILCEACCFALDIVVLVIGM